MNDYLSGGFLAAPKPKSAGDYLHDARTWLDAHTPGLGAIAPFIGGAGGAAMTGTTQGDVLNNSPVVAQIKKRIADAQTNRALSDPSMLGPSTLPYTATPVPQSLTPAAAPAPALAAPTAVPPLPPATNVGPGVIGGAQPTQVSGNGYNHLDAEANVSGDGYNALDAAANDKPYNLAGRLGAAGKSLSDGGMGFFERNTAMQRDQNGDFLDPQAGRQAEATGPDLIQKYLNRLHGKA